MAATAPTEWYGYAEDELLADLEAVYQRYKGAGANFIVAHSFGTVIASRLCAKPSVTPTVTALALIGSAYDKPAGTEHPIFYLPAWALNWLRIPMSNAFKAAAFHPDTPADIVEQEAAKTADNQMHMVRAFYRQVQWDCHSSFPKLTMPVLLITGESDTLTTPEQAQKVKKVLPNASAVVVPLAGHMVMGEQPRAVITALEGLFHRCGVPAVESPGVGAGAGAGAPAAAPEDVELEHK